jgi:D-glycero-alpha-D-manno-heptose 1-phosphate guanylyltransferase
LLGGSNAQFLVFVDYVHEGTFSVVGGVPTLGGDLATLGAGIVNLGGGSWELTNLFGGESSDFWSWQTAPGPQHVALISAQFGVQPQPQPQPQLPPSVPEPKTFPLFATGLGLMALLMRRKKSKCASGRHARSVNPILDVMEDFEHEAVILAGGLGNRLRPAVNDRPKSLADVVGRPFLEYLFKQLLNFEFRRAILCIGYCGEQVRVRFGKSYGALTLDYSFETHPLGTGGALRKAASLVRGYHVLAMNGDSYCDMDVTAFAKAHLQYAGEATIAAACFKDRLGTVELNADNRVVEFARHPLARLPGHINAGVYMFRREVLNAIPEGREISLENEVFPRLVARRSLFGWPVEPTLIDIGTPETYLAAQKFFAEI